LIEAALGPVAPLMKMLEGPELPSTIVSFSMDRERCASPPLSIRFGPYADALCKLKKNRKHDCLIHRGGGGGGGTFVGQNGKGLEGHMPRSLLQEHADAFLGDYVEVCGRR
jgi:hypothetical protein